MKYRDTGAILNSIVSNNYSPFAGSRHMVLNELCWDLSYTFKLSKQKKVGPDWYDFLCLQSLAVLFVSQHNLFRIM